MEETKFNTPSDFKISILSLVISESVTDLGVWPMVLSKVEKCLEKSPEREKTGRSDKISGPNNGNKTWTHIKLSPDLNLS